MLIALACRTGVADAVAEALFRAYFQEGLDIGSPDVLVDVATQAGIGRKAAFAALLDETLDSHVEDLKQQVVRIGVAGVPFFIVNGTWAISGAQPPRYWVRALQDIASRPARVKQYGQASDEGRS
jgi:predicted DsbA family dithiol-disulfide isomerase